MRASIPERCGRAEAHLKSASITLDAILPSMNDGDWRKRMLQDLVDRIDKALADVEDDQP